MLSKQVMDEINQFQDPEVREKTLAAAEIVAERLNGHTNRLKLVSDIKLIATLVDAQEGPGLKEALHTCACPGHPVSNTPISLTDADAELNKALERLHNAKNDVTSFLNDRLSPFLLPPVEARASVGTACMRSDLVSPTARIILNAADSVSRMTEELLAALADANERLLV